MQERKRIAGAHSVQILQSSGLRNSGMFRFARAAARNGTVRTADQDLNRPIAAQTEVKMMTRIAFTFLLILALAALAIVASGCNGIGVLDTEEGSGPAEATGFSNAEDQPSFSPSAASPYNEDREQRSSGRRRME